MKKLVLIGAIALACTFTQTANAQSFLQKLLSGAANSAATTTNTQPQGATGQDILGTLLNNAVGNATNQASSKNQQLGGILGNLISSFTGNATTTKANLIGNWSYTAPSVQFESENALTQAGGTAIAAKCETKLAQYYKIVGIKPGKLTFAFAEDGTVTYSVGTRTLQGTYVFDNEKKMVAITTQMGQTVNAYVTISGPQMSLCFDGTKLLTLFTAISAKFQTLSTVSALAANYKGMKVGFKFEKK